MQYILKSLIRTWLLYAKYKHRTALLWLPYETDSTAWYGDVTILSITYRNYVAWTGLQTRKTACLVEDSLRRVAKKVCFVYEGRGVCRR